VPEQEVIRSFSHLARYDPQSILFFEPARRLGSRPA
jgi:hypothetical protein